MADRQPPTVPPAEALRGIVLVTLGYAVIACSDGAVKWVLPEAGVALVMIWRGVIGAAVVAAFARGRGLWPRNTRLIAARSGLHCAVSACWYVAWLNGLPLVDSYAVGAANPLVMTLLAIPMLGERVGWRRWAATSAGFGGVLFMLQPGGDLWRWEAGLVLGGVFAIAVTRIWTRQLAATDTPAAVAFWLLLAHVPAGLLLLPFFPAPSFVPSAGGLAALLILGAANGLAHLLFARAFALAPVSVLAPFEYTILLWGLLLGLLIWAEVPAMTTLLGAGVVVAAGIYNLHRARADSGDR